MIAPDGYLRNWTIHIPQYYDVNRASPLIMAFPGNGEAAGNIEAESGLSSPDVNPYAIMAYVNGYNLGFASNPNWGVPGSANAGVNDISFIKALITNLTASYCIDTGRIFATGHSNGAGFCGVMACDPVLSMTVAAFAPNSGAFYTNFTSGDPATIEPVNTPIQPLCSPGRNTVPILEFHGTSDDVISYTGGARNGRILPTTPHWVNDWSIRQGYGTANITTSLTSLNPNMAVTRYQYGGDAGQLGIVTHYMLTNWTHTFPNPSNVASAPVNAPSIMMDFFYRYTNTTQASSATSSSSTVSSTSTATSSSLSSSTVSTSSSMSSSISSSSSSPTSYSTSSSMSSSSSSSSSSMSSLISSSMSSSSGSSSGPPTSSATSSSTSSSSPSSSLSSSTAGSSLLVLTEQQCIQHDLEQQHTLSWAQLQLSNEFNNCCYLIEYLFGRFGLDDSQSQRTMRCSKQRHNVHRLWLWRLLLRFKFVLIQLTDESNFHRIILVLFGPIEPRRLRHYNQQHDSTGEYDLVSRFIDCIDRISIGF
ncbi:hypothetical protein B0A50_04423 [Salinomyces thailandicus]|uniref:feruloyl esterase n=1 Tax=Salinomyces thailandicus TaxID=706561 RepID=A0A4U0TYI5_9PEZI|nr:hypothetical protein B0A50_04423 [Salinomyces thailandica]